MTPLEAWIKDKILPFPTVKDYQLAKLKETVDYVKEHSSFYRRQLASLSSSDLTAPEDLARWPLTYPQQLAARPLSFVCVSQDEIERVVTLETSATTGPEKRLFFTGEDLDSTVDFFQHGMSVLAGEGDRVLILLPGERPGSVGHLLARALPRIGAQPVLHGFIRNFPEAAGLIRDQKITVLVGAPIQILGLARYMQGCGSPVPGTVRAMLLTTDYVSPAVISCAQEVFGGEVFNHYGMTEMGLGGAVDCSAHAGYHLREPDLYLEIVDPLTKTPTAEGRTGEIVVTTLTRRGMPLIRYATGDLAAFLPGPCPCGSGLKRLSTVKDRQTGMIVLPGGEMLSMSALDDIVFAARPIADFQAVATRSGDRVNLRLKCRLIGSVSPAGLRRLARDIKDRFPTMGDLTLETEICEAPWPPGKRQITKIGF